MMNVFESPFDFKQKIIFENNTIEFVNLIEIGQGGPLVGGVRINGKDVNGRFGGPILSRDGVSFYLPVYQRRFLRAGFRLAQIKMPSLDVTCLSRLKSLIFLDEITENRVYYFESMDKHLRKFVNV